MISRLERTCLAGQLSKCANQVMRDCRVIAEFCRELSLCVRSHSVNDGKDWYKVICFAEREDAVAFMAHFGGEGLDLAQRRRGARWAQWKRDDVSKWGEAIPLPRSHPPRGRGSAPVRARPTRPEVLEQLGCRKVVDTTFMTAFMLPHSVDPVDVARYVNGLCRAQMDADLAPEKYNISFSRRFQNAAGRAST